VGRRGTATAASGAGTIASGGPLRSPINLSEFPEGLAACHRPWYEFVYTN
jgi:hypothetical protein